MIDSHCHLTDGKLLGEVNKIVEEAKEVGVEKIIVPGTDLHDARLVIQLTKVYENVFGLLGVYPGNLRNKDLEEAVDKLKKMIIENEKIVGIGEIGLDRYWMEKQEVKEVTVFKRQMELAVELDIPVMIHSRGSGEKMKEVLENMGSLPRGQFHCFGESSQFLGYILEKGFNVSFCGNVTYKSADNLRELVKMVPLERLLLETDAPYLPPEPLRGTRNVPANVRITGEYIAKLLGVNADELFKVTSENAMRLYKLN